MPAQVIKITVRRQHILKNLLACSGRRSMHMIQQDPATTVKRGKFHGS
jgi:hypothetical protein